VLLAPATAPISGIRAHIRPSSARSKITVYVIAFSSLPFRELPILSPVVPCSEGSLGTRNKRNGAVRLCARSTDEFIQDSIQHEVAKKIGDPDSFCEFYRYRVSISELRSWENSLQAPTNQILYCNRRDNVISMRGGSS
jgi:hypothetical protein